MSFRKPGHWVGPTSWQDIKAAFEERCPGLLEVQLSDEEERVASLAAWNQGIDKHLDAIARPATIQWLDKDKTKLQLSLDVSSLLVFLRRLYELPENRAAAQALRKAILGVLGITED